MRLPRIEPEKLAQVIDDLELAQTRRLVKAYQERIRLPRSLIASPELARFLARALASGTPNYTEPEALQKPDSPMPPDIALMLEDRRQVAKWNDRIRTDDPSLLDYSKLEGDWHDWLEVAKAYELKVPTQDRADIRHDILIELARARARDGEPIPLLRAYRIASLIVALYWREQLKVKVKVCVYSGLPVEPYCSSCIRKPKNAGRGSCPYLALRPFTSLESEVEGESERVRLIETIADDHAIDLDDWLDAKAFKSGCSLRLVQIAYKKRAGEPLSWKDHKYWERTVAKERKRYQKTLF